MGQRGQAPGRRQHVLRAAHLWRPPARALLAQTNPDAPKPQDGAATRRRALQNNAKELERQQGNVVAELQTYQSTGDDAIDQQWRTQLRTSFAALAHQRKAVDRELPTLTNQPVDAGSGDPAVLDQLPVLDVDLASLAEDLQRELFDCFQLQVRYNRQNAPSGENR